MRGQMGSHVHADVHKHRQRALTLYMWANSISKGVSRERGGGFTVTEMTLEFRTVVFLGSASRPRQVPRSRPSCRHRPTSGPLS